MTYLSTAAQISAPGSHDRRYGLGTPPRRMPAATARAGFAHSPPAGRVSYRPHATYFAEEMPLASHFLRAARLGRPHFRRKSRNRDVTAFYFRDTDATFFAACATARRLFCACAS